MAKFSSRRRCSRAFILVELLVVVAILGVLAALLLPALRRSIDAGRSVKCASNLRQIGMALNSYAGEHEQHFPTVNSENTAGQTWMWQLKPYLNMADNSMGAAPLPRAAGIFLCPAFRPVGTRDVSYALNTCITIVSGRAWQYDILRVQQVGTIVVAEVAYNGDIYSPFSGSPLVRRHPGPSANYLFVDGHVENIRDLIPATDRRWDPSRQ